MKNQTLGDLARAGRVDINGVKLKKGDWVRSTPAYDTKLVYEGVIDSVSRTNLIIVDGYRSSSTFWEKIDQPGPERLIRRKNIIKRLNRSAQNLRILTYRDLEKMMNKDTLFRGLLSKEDFRILERAPLEPHELAAILR